MADDILTIQIGSAASLVEATLTVDNTANIVNADVSLLDGGIQIPVNVTSATLGAGGVVSVVGTTPIGTTVGIDFTEGTPIATITTTTAGITTSNTEAAVIVCFCTGTLILTARGEVAIEDLKIGDLAATASGAHRPIRWIGHRTTDLRFHPRPLDTQPVCIAAHAFGQGRPARDLRVSPGHSVCIDVLGEVLIPASALVNGTTIQQEKVDEVTYWHVELDSHDILLANNLPAESYMEMGNRGFFDRGGTEPNADAAQRTHADFCRPFHASGPLVEGVKTQLRARAEKLGWTLSEEPFAGLHIVVDGQRIEPAIRGLSARFAIPADARSLHLVTATSRPCDIGMNGDTRDLGLCLRGLTTIDGFDSRAIDLGDPLLSAGLHEAEDDGYRWTAGRALLPSEFWAGLTGEFFLRVDLARPALPRWLGPVGESRQNLQTPDERRPGIYLVA